MTKTLSLEVSKRLRVHLESVECEYVWCYIVDEWQYVIVTDFILNELDIKTLNLEEAIKFLPYIHKGYNDTFFLRIERSYIDSKKWMVSYSSCEPCDDIKSVEWNTLLEAVEAMIVYLLDNDLLWLD